MKYILLLSFSDRLAESKILPKKEGEIVSAITHPILTGIPNGKQIQNPRAESFRMICNRSRNVEF